MTEEPSTLGAGAVAPAPTLVPAGPLQKCLREAGLPLTARALEALETIARQWAFTPTIKDMRRAARLYRKASENPKRLHKAHPTEPEMTKARAEKVLRTAHGLKSGRQWTKWKKAQRRLMKANQPPEDTHAPPA